MGILLHPTSLPGPYGIGDIGPGARHFVDWLARAGVTVWQVLPTCPPGGPLDDNPYASWAGRAGNPDLISLEDLVTDGLLRPSEIPPVVTFEEGWADHQRAVPAKLRAVDTAVSRLKISGLAEYFQAFRDVGGWALQAARFWARKVHAGGAPWWKWPEALAGRASAAMSRADASLRTDIDRALGRLFLFERQWAALRAYARERGVALLGDVPIYVLRDSADVWATPEQWRLDDAGAPIAVSGTPPDVFSSEGQLWGGPLYDWARMKGDDYAWWRSRLSRALEHFDAVRIDHFRAFSAYWEVPAAATSARDGRWVAGPGAHFFKTIERYLGRMQLCAEDLGVIDDGVRDLLAETGIPGMKILHYGFGEGPDNPHLPHNIPKRSVVYPGNHDNDTSLGWWSTLSTDTRSHVQHYLGRHGHDIAWDLNRAALQTRAQLAVLQMQDILSLPGWARMNAPTSYRLPIDQWRNWRWRLKPGEANEEVADRLRFLGSLYSRC